MIPWRQLTSRTATGIQAGCQDELRLRQAYSVLVARIELRVLQISYADEESVQERRERVTGLVLRQRGADLVVLPELWAPGGFSYRHWSQRAEPIHGPTMTAVAAAAADIGAHVHAGSIVEESPTGRLFNTSALFGPDGAMVATYRKIHRFGFGEGEKQLLASGDALAALPVELAGRQVTLALSTCYDLRFPEMFRGLLDLGAEIVLTPAAWPMARVEIWQLLARARAVENQTFVVAANTAGSHAGHQMGGHSLVIGPDGAILAAAGQDEEVLAATVDVDAVAELREAFPVLADRQPAQLFQGRQR